MENEKLDQLTLTVMEMNLELNDLKEQIAQILEIVTQLQAGGGVADIGPVTYRKISLKAGIEVDKKILDKALNHFSTALLGDVYLFKQFYLSHERDPPIKKINTRRIDYWDGNEWVQSDKKSIKMIVCKNIQTAYMKHNRIDKVGRDKFKHGQQRILKLMDPKFQEDVIGRILENIK